MATKEAESPTGKPVGLLSDQSGGDGQVEKPPLSHVELESRASVGNDDCGVVVEEVDTEVADCSEWWFGRP